MDINIKFMVVFSKLNRVFLERLTKNLESLDMPGSAYLMMAHLNEVGRAKTQKLGEIAVITSGSITHMVNKLIKMDYIEKVQDEDDKRITWIILTDYGKKIFQHVHLEHMKYLDSLLSDFSEEEKDMFIKQMKYFGKKVENKMI